MEGYAFVTIASRLLFLSTNNQLGFWKDCVSDLDRILAADKKLNKEGDQVEKKVDRHQFLVFLKLARFRSREVAASYSWLMGFGCLEWESFSKFGQV